MAPLVAAYAAVLVAELLGDRSMYAIATLSARFGPATVLAGAIPAFMLKALAAVLFGNLLLRLPHWFVAALAALTFFISAIVLWRGETERVHHAIPAGFAAVFFTEWADIGQLVTATVTAQFDAPLMVWIGASLALITKGVIAATIGAPLKSRIPAARLRWGALAVYVILGVLAVVE